MRRGNFDDLHAFVVVAREGSFTQAAARLSVSQSALSHALRSLEERLGLRLLTRTTRSVSPTDAGERLLRVAEPRFDEIQNELSSLRELRDAPAGTVRITAIEHAANSIIWPKLTPLLRQFPDIKVEVSNDYGLTDIAAERFDLGVRLGEQVEQDMIAVPIGPEMRMAAVASPEYFQGREAPETPQDLPEHNCINMRLPTYGGLYAWEFEKDGRELQVRVEGQVTVDAVPQLLGAALSGLGLAYLPEDVVEPYLADGQLMRVLEDWCPSFPGFHLYYPHRSHLSPVLALVIDALRH